jgi:diguanylate cyclase (GGDEF)-like protein
MDRPYRAALPVEKAVEIMRQQRGKLFDPQILDAFLEDLPAFVKDLERELKCERARTLLDQSPAEKVGQTWLSDTEANDSVLRRITVEKLASAPERLISLYDMLHVLGSSLNTQQTIKQALVALRRVIPYDQAGIFLLEGDHYSLAQGEGIPDYCISRFTLSAAHGALAHAAAARLPLLLPGAPVELAAGLNQCLANARESLVAPLVDNDAIVGGIMLCASSPDRFTQDHAWFLGLITPKLAATVRCARDVQALRDEAATDPVTRLPNARAAFQRMEEEIRRASREGRRLAVLFLDLNHFKQINDTYGHVVGDKVLAETAEKLRQSLRPYDFLGRVGGDEFLAVLPGIDDENLRAKVASLKKLVEQNVVAAGEGVEVSTSVSVGVACFPRDGKDAEELMFRSDQRMYEDKRKISAALSSPAPAPAAKTLDRAFVI